MIRKKSTYGLKKSFTLLLGLFVTASFSLQALANEKYTVNAYPLPEGYRYNDPVIMTASTSGRIGVVKTDYSGMHGYMDAKGNVVIPAHYKHIEYFKEGMAYVTTPETSGFINAAGEMIIKDATSLGINYGFNEGFAVAFGSDVYDDNGGRRIIISDKDGNLLIPTDRYHDAGFEFSDGMLNVARNGKWGYINTAGEEVIPLQFDSAGAFQDGFAYVGNANREIGFINKSGMLVVPYQYRIDLLGPFERKIIDGQTVVIKNDKQGVINCKTGEELIPAIYEDVSRFARSYDNILGGDYRNYWKVRNNGRVWLVNDKGEVVTESPYNTINVSRDNKSSMLKVGQPELDIYHYPQGPYGLFDIATESMVLPKEYEDIGCLSEGLIAVKKDGKIGFVDENNTVKIPFQYDTCLMSVDYVQFRYGRAIVNEHGYYGIIDRDCNYIVEPIYSGMDSFELNGACYYAAYTGEPRANTTRWGLLDQNGNIIVPLQYRTFNIISQDEKSNTLLFRADDAEFKQYIVNVTVN